jgi:hypothetical protein
MWAEGAANRSAPGRCRRASREAMRISGNRRAIGASSKQKGGNSPSSVLRKQGTVTRSEKNPAPGTDKGQSAVS